MPATSITPVGPDPDPIAKLIHSQRMLREWSLARLASAAKLRSPAYVFHIENGTKTPSPGVARRLAVALGLDPELLAAWSVSRGRAGLASALDAAERVRAWLDESGAGSLPGLHEHRGGTQPRSDSVQVPIIPEGADPLAGDLEDLAIESIRIDRALLPPLEAGARLVGFRLSAHGARRVPESLRTGDCVIVLLSGEAAGPDTPCAVRVGARVEIMRWRAGTGDTHLPLPVTTTDSERSLARTNPAEAGTIVGRVVLAIRRWL